MIPPFNSSRWGKECLLYYWILNEYWIFFTIQGGCRIATRGYFFNPESLSLSKHSPIKKHKWGILAPGKMSAKFTRGLKLFENAELYAIGSREKARAKKFAEEFGFKKY